jgi:hypothetical protein
MYCANCGNRADNCICGAKFKSFKSIAKSIDELNQNEYFYTTQPAKQVFAVITKSNKEWRITTKKCLVIDPKTGDVLDSLTRVERRN